MRHITGFFLALVMSAALFFGGGWGVTRFSALEAGQGLRTAHALTDLHNVLPLAALLGTGLLLGILLAVRRISALATGLPGLGLLGWSGLLLVRGRPALSYVPMPGSHYAAGFTTMLSSGVIALLSAGMIIPLFMPSRWRSAATEIEEYDDDFSVASTLGLVP
jgi:CDP-diglyceride synthetase